MKHPFHGIGSLAILAVFARVGLGKMILHARFLHDGFVLAMSVTRMLATRLAYVGPVGVDSRDQRGIVCWVAR